MIGENWVDCVGLTFFCDSMVEELYSFRKTSEVSKKLAENCEKAVKEFKGFYWLRGGEYIEHSVASTLFNKAVNLNTLESFWKDAGKELDEQSVDEMIGDLEYVVQNNPLPQRLETAAKLQRIFDTLGNYSFNATRDCMRRSSDDCRALVA